MPRAFGQSRAYEPAGVAAIVLIAINLLFALRLISTRRAGPLRFLQGATTADHRGLPPLSGSPVYLAIYQRRYTLDMIGLRGAIQAVPRQAKILILVDDPNGSLQTLVPSDDRTFVVATDLNRARRMLGMPPSLDRWLYFNSDGKVVASGDLSSLDIRTALGSVNNPGKSAPQQELRAMIERLERRGDFQREHALAARLHSASFTVLFVNFACSGCQIADAIRAIEQAGKLQPHLFAIEVPADWGPHDRSILANNLGVKLSILAASPSVTTAWKLVTSQYGVARTNGFALTVGPGAGVTLEPDLERVARFLKVSAPRITNTP